MINNIVDIYNFIKNDTYLKTVLDIEKANLFREEEFIADCKAKDTSNLFLDSIHVHLNSQKSYIYIWYIVKDVSVPKEFVDKNIIDTAVLTEIVDFIFKYAESVGINPITNRMGQLEVNFPDIARICKFKNSKDFKLILNNYSLAFYQNKNYCVISNLLKNFETKFDFSEKVDYEFTFLEGIKKVLRSLELEHIFKKRSSLGDGIKEKLNKILDIIEKNKNN